MRYGPCNSQVMAERHPSSLRATRYDAGKAATNPNAAASRIGRTAVYPITRTAITAVPARVEPRKI